MALIQVKNIGPHKVHFRDPEKNHEVVDLIFFDPRGQSHKSRFILAELLGALAVENGQVASVDSIFITADQFEIVR